MKPVELWCETRGPLTLAAVVHERRLLALEADHDRLQPRAGAILTARITGMLPKFRSAEVNLGPCGPAFLDTGKHRFASGDSVTVEWLSPAVPGKLQTVRLSEQPAGPGPDALVRATAGRTIAAARVNTPKLHKQLASFGVEAEVAPAPFELIDLNHQIDGLLARRVELAQGAHLVFDRTEALHVIDINGGGIGAEANMPALAEIARQLRLRNLGGMILIDSIGGKNTGLVEELRRLTADDPCRVEVFGITRLGLIEVTRVRRGYPLARYFAAPTSPP